MCIIEKSKKNIAKNFKLIFSGTDKNFHDTIECLKNIVHYLNIKMPNILFDIIELNFLVHSNEMACRKGGRLGLYHVIAAVPIIATKAPFFQVIKYLLVYHLFFTKETITYCFSNCS